MKVSQGLLIALGLMMLLIYSSIYTVDQRERAIKFRFQKIVDAAHPIEPGLHFKWPTTIIDRVRKFPAQVLPLQVAKQRFLTGEKKFLEVDFFVEWRIENFDVFYRSTRGNIDRATPLLESIMTAGLRAEFGKRSIQEAVTAQRGEIMSSLLVNSKSATKELGVKIVDIRVSRIDFPDDTSDAIYERMKSERHRVAQDFRSRGEEEATKLMATADRKSKVLLASAYKKSEILRGEGDAKAAAIYAAAYGKNEEFYAFYRSLSAYKKSLGGTDDTLVIEPSSEFFQYFKSMGNSE
ncbi:MAG: protease modulator HflC [Thiotrichaceae bacterium]|nr:protease modulator HflC [Thiotrichaceae bacterium]